MTKHCIACRKEFIQKSKFHPNQIYCSKGCIKKEWKKRNPEQTRAANNASARRCRGRDPERYRFYVKNRRHAIRAATGGVSGKNFSRAFTLIEWQALKESYHYKCPFCLRVEPEIKLTIDHIVPLSKGGKHAGDNIQPLCHSCNSAKKDKTDFFPLRNTGLLEPTV